MQLRVSKSVRARLNDAGSQHLFGLVDYYLREDRPLSALIYIKTILRKYPDTRAAAEAGRRLPSVQKAVNAARRGIPIP